MAYGKEGFRQLVSDNCRQAQQLAAWIENSPDYELLTPCKLNVVVFRPRVREGITVLQRLKQINASGEVFMTPDQWQGHSAIRAAFSNWRTEPADVEKVCALLAGFGAASL